MKTDAIKMAIRDAQDFTHPSVIEEATEQLTALETAIAEKDEALKDAAWMLISIADERDTPEHDQSPSEYIRKQGEIAEKAALSSEPTGKVVVCEWSYDPFDECSMWQTDCGHEFVIIDGKPSQNGMEFCCYCGKKLVERVIAREA